MDDDEVEAASAGISRSLAFHTVDPPPCFIRVNAREVLSKSSADAATALCGDALARENADMVSGITKSMGVDLLRAINPTWEQSSTYVHMECFEHEAAAVDTFIACNTHGDAADAVLKVGSRNYGGFGDYGLSFAPEHVTGVQRAATVLLKHDFFAPSAVRTSGLTAIHILESAVSGKITKVAAESGFPVNMRLIQAHVIRQGSLLACWKPHKDTSGDLRGANITAVTNVTKYNTAMRVCGARSHADYSQQGDTAIFPSDMWHYTSAASVGTIKLALFYSITLAKSGRSAHFTSSPEAPITTARDMSAGSSAQRLSVAQRKGSRSSASVSSTNISDSCANEESHIVGADLPIKKRVRHE